MDTQTAYQNAIKFAAVKHGEQTIPGTTISYVVHLSNVAMEILLASHYSPAFNVTLAVQIALLHDTLEDTTTTFEELANNFSPDVANGVLALTKNSALPKAERMTDSLRRIKAMLKEVWSVKLADRITNLQMPPQHWDNAKKLEYSGEATVILETLTGGNTYLEKRLSDKIQAYETYLDRQIAT
jgi:guanosine-3',5'-bis(diphosphate) 3'-pyrophosphohydrolase